MFQVLIDKWVYRDIGVIDLHQVRLAMYLKKRRQFLENSVGR